MESEINIMSLFLTIMSGVLVFVVGQTILKLFVEPWQKQRECIAKIAHHLILYANVYANPGVGTKAVNNEASIETRNLASELIASCHRIPFYKQLANIKLFPANDKIIEVQKNLIGLSNSMHNGNPLHNASKADTIKKLLRIRFSE